MDPGRKLDERYQSPDQGRLVEAYREETYENQPLGPALKRDKIVVKIDVAYLRVFGLFVCFLIVLVSMTIWAGVSR
jgi:hypothetical protein